MDTYENKFTIEFTDNLNKKDLKKKSVASNPHLQSYGLSSNAADKSFYTFMKVVPLNCMDESMDALLREQE